MNRYPLWKYLVIAAVLVWATLYTLPNFFGEAPAVQVSSAKATLKVGTDTLGKVEAALKAANVQADSVMLDGASVKARFANTQTQIQGRDAIIEALNPDPADASYTISSNLLPRTPNWLMRIHALPMYLGLDLRGGIHLMLKVDTKAALTQRAEALMGEVRRFLREKELRQAGITRTEQTLEIKFNDVAVAGQARNALSDQFRDMNFAQLPDGAQTKLLATFKPEAVTRIQEQAVKQNISTLHNRVNELGVSEPVIQQQGIDRIVVQLAGVQDMARVQQIIGRIATLELRLVDESAEGRAAELGNGAVPLGSERFFDRDQRPVIVHREVILTGENLTDAQPGFDQNQQAAVNLTLDGKGAKIFKQVTAENINKRMAILLFEKGKGEVVTAPVIRDEIGGGNVQISGAMTTPEAADTALLLRAGSLAAPMEIIEERMIGPSQGEENIKAGFLSVKWGFAAVALFMCVYYALFGVFSTIALGFNLLMLVAVLSMMQATLTLPGMAAMALVLGMAIDSNVLINERIREELRNGQSPQKAISAGFDHAWATILDSNITTLIAGLALLAFGTGAVRGFAVVHCLGILTSMFSSVFFARGLVNWWYGGKKKLEKLSIGTVWRPEGRALTADETDALEEVSSSPAAAADTPLLKA